MEPMHPLTREILARLAPCLRLPSLTLDEASLHDCYADFPPHEVSLATRLGPVTLEAPVLAAAMDTVSGPEMAGALATLGGAAIIYRDTDQHAQRAMVEEALQSRPGLISRLVSANDDDKLRHVKKIKKDTIPVITRTGLLRGIIFRRGLSFDGHEDDSVCQWMMPLDELKSVEPGTPFAHIRERLLSERNCSVLPVVDHEGSFHGMYFMQDMRNISHPACRPAWHHGKPVVGLAVGANKEDLWRVHEALGLGASLVVIDSSHGNCQAVIEQTARLKAITADRAALIAGNVASIDGYVRLALAGADAVKAGIGSGSICTTTQVTGIGVPMQVLIRRLSLARSEMARLGAPTPAIIADGGVESPGLAVRALAAGADAVMAGKWLVAADEAGSRLRHHEWRTRAGDADYHHYRGMASAAAIEEQLAAERYDRMKTAAEGVAGWVPSKGPLWKWFPKDLENMQNGFCHLGARSISDIQRRGNDPEAWYQLSFSGQIQAGIRVRTEP